MTEKDDLIALRDAVNLGIDTAHHHANAFPSESAYGHCTWHDSHKASSHGSVDAALAFLAAALPVWRAMIATHAAWADVWNPGDTETTNRPIRGRAETPARALLLATLNALIAEADKAHTAMERI